MNRFLCTIMLCFGIIICSQKKNYDQIKMIIDQYEKNDERALKYVNQFLRLAKEDQNYTHQVEGYREAVYYAKTKELKLSYADSTIQAAKKSGDAELLTVSYLGKGIVYYSNYKKYDKALTEYLLASQYAKDIKDLYLRNKVNYHIGVVKSYLGYYEEAADIFKNCLIFFEKQMQESTNDNERYNNTKGYLNTLHQLTVCMRNQEYYKKSDSLLEIGLSASLHKKEFALEYAYFLKCKGISEYRKKNYENSISSFQKALPSLEKFNDFGWLSVTYYYWGKDLQELDKKNEAIQYFEKVNSIFVKDEFIFPEVIEVYDHLADYYKENNNQSQLVYFTRQGAKADRWIKNQFTNLAPTLHKEYDNKLFKEEKRSLQYKGVVKTILITGLIIAMVILLLLYYQHLKNEKLISAKYEDLLKRLQNKGKIEYFVENHPKDDLHKKNIISTATENGIRIQLEQFEKQNKFRQKRITLTDLAKKLNTNSNYLSQIIREEKGMNFKDYIAHLRISYITQLLYSDTRYLQYTIEALAEECGIASRQSFSNLFYEVNGIRPTDFIRKRKQELGIT